MSNDKVSEVISRKFPSSGTSEQVTLADALEEIDSEYELLEEGSMAADFDALYTALIAAVDALNEIRP